MSNEQIQQQLQEHFGDTVKGFEESYGMLTFEAETGRNIDVLRFLYEQGFRFLTDVTAVHYPAFAGREIAVVYHLHNLVDNIRIRFKVFAPIAKPDVASATAIFESANWQEREAYDFFGVNFTGHPNLKRIQNVEEMDYFPLRKEFPLEDQTRIDKDDEMFGRGGSFDFGNRQEDGSPAQLANNE
ncbi:MAG: NADH-quinone oxidoreductase subunit C [Chitinophagaceae bacterium]|nr:MAG: NADH-quinone oxidoreductase subunit C [Chitinophagaceae bacterium]